MPQNNKKTNLDNSQAFNYHYCKMTIKGVDVMSQNIRVLNVRESIFDVIPVMEMELIDNGIFSEKYPLEDGDIIFVEISKNKNSKPVINLEFELHDFSIDNLDGDNITLSIIKMTGYLKNKNLFFPPQNRSFKNQSSSQVISRIAQEEGFNYIGRLVASDAMTWLQVNQSNYGFIFHVIERAFKSEDVVVCGITRHKNLIYTSVGTEIKNKNTKKAIFDPKMTISDEVETAKKTQEFYFNNYKVISLLGTSNKMTGYGLKYGIYDFESFSEDKVTNNNNKMSEFINRNKDNSGKISEYSMTGIETRNTHKNYFKAINQNRFISEDFFKTCFILYINVNDNINLFDKINVVFPAMDNVKNINDSMSGEYMVGGIIHQISKDGYYRMALTLFRNGFNSNEFLKSNQVKMVK